MRLLDHSTGLLRLVGNWLFGIYVFTTKYTRLIFGDRLMGAYFRGLAHVPLLRLVSVPVWTTTLRRANRIYLAIEWMDWVCGRWPYPQFLISRVNLLLLARRFADVRTFLVQHKETILFHPKGKHFSGQLADIEAMMAIESGDVPPEAAGFAVGGSPAIVDYCYQRIWDSHSATNAGKVRYFANYYLKAVNYEPSSVFYLADTIMVPNALWVDIIAALEQVENYCEGGYKKNIFELIQSLPPHVSGVFAKAEFIISHFFKQSKSDQLRRDIFSRCTLALIEVGDIERAKAVIEREFDNTDDFHVLAGAVAAAESGKSASIEAHRFLERAFSSSKLSRKARAELAGNIAVSYEEKKEFASAKQYYVSAYRLGGVPYYLPTYLWRYVSLCLAQGAYAEGALVFDEALPLSWIHFSRLAKTPITRRLKTRRMIPPDGAFIIGCWGIGDDIIRMAMFDALYKGSNNTRFGLSVDPRMQGLYARSFENFEVIPISRMNGPFAVSEREYFYLRDGLPAGVDRGRVDINVFKALERYPDVALTEDMMNAFFWAGPDIRRPNRPMLKVLPEKREAARRWLATLPPGPNVGISWRSGDRNLQRDKSYVDIVEDCAELLSRPGINFINLQYSWDPQELKDAEERHGCVIHTPAFDLKNDIEDILAMGLELDVVIAPCTAVRDMCAAAGANVWALAVTPFLPDLWRLDTDRKTDRLFPSMTHFTAHEFGDARSVLAEIGRRLSALAQGPKPDAPV